MSCKSRNILCLVCFSTFLLFYGAVSVDYGTALTKSLLYYEAQRSGKLPSNQRVKWRGDSALNDGSDANIDLTGGYYDGGDNVKFGFPKAFTITMLAWSAIDFNSKLTAMKAITNALSAIKWGTDYLLKPHPEPDVLYGELGDGDTDHACWMRPEDMTTPRTSFKIDDKHPGSDLAAETAAALAAAFITFRASDTSYSNQLLEHAKQLFDFGRNHQGVYQSSIPVAGKFYSSSGYGDELLWAAAWVHRATNEQSYLDFLSGTGNTGGTGTEFSWDDKYVGAQVLAAKLVLKGNAGINSERMAEFKSQTEQFFCSCAQKGNNKVMKSPGGLLWFQPWNNLQYTTTAAFIAIVYSKYLSHSKASIQCPGGALEPSELVDLARYQVSTRLNLYCLYGVYVDYILGSNPKKMSCMVGFGSSYPTQVRHRGATMVSIKLDPTTVSFQDGMNKWFNKNEPNPNVLDGAVVGGPDANDQYTDSRSNYQMAEPATVTVAPLVGVLAFFASSN